MGRVKRPNNDGGNSPNKRILIHLINFNDPDNIDDPGSGSSHDSHNSDDSYHPNTPVDTGNILTGKCRNQKCDHKAFTKRELSMGMDKIDMELDSKNLGNIETIDDLIGLGYYYHCKKRKTYKDIDLEKLFNLIEPLMEMKDLVGMKAVKESMVDQILFFLQKLNKKEKCGECISCINNVNDIQCINIKENDDMLHTVITGPPGVGKTELGRILGMVYKAMGILSKGHVNIARRPDLIAKYLGQTAPKTQAFIDKCRGGVMFIDEAYSLGNPEGRDSFSKECIDTINQNLTERRDFLCIIAGYEDALEASFFSYNEGLKRRFSFRYNIEKYTGEELYQMFKIKISKEGWTYSDPDEKLIEFFNKNLESFPRFGGDVETLFLRTKIMHSRRIMFKDPSLRKKINLDDVRKGFDKFISHRKDNDDKLPKTVSHIYM